MSRSRIFATTMVVSAGLLIAQQGCIFSSGDGGRPEEGGNGTGATSAGGNDGGSGGAHQCGDAYQQQPGPIARTCGAPTDDECDGSVDVNDALPNGQYGNMFDDDCDGLVDEGCECPTGSFAGDVRDCWLTPSSQIDPDTNRPVGWCAEHAGGTRKCIAGTEGSPDVWSGECRGAQEPAPSDHCVVGDFDCDGLDLNSAEDCACVDDTELVACPTEPIVTAPFPDPTQLLEIDGNAWLDPTAATAATGWTWTVTGGDCDNILPHPSFAVFDSADTTSGNRIGIETEGLGLDGHQQGFVVEGASAQIYPAFALSGDYLVRAEFDVAGVPYECNVKVHVRAPGIRAEACWTPMPNDMDLHLGRLQNSDGCLTGNHGWFDTCDWGAGSEDCYFSNCTGFGTDPSSWGYAQSDETACKGWGSRRLGPCDNPRLDLDNISCDPTTTEPGSSDGFSDFCGAENINLDNPGDGDRFAVALHAYGISGDVKSHLNIYCNGERRLSLGADNAGQEFPVAQLSGGTAGGDFWQAVVVEAVVDGNGTMTDCIIEPIHSTSPDPQLDGSSDFCVDRDPQGGAASGSAEWYFQPGGTIPQDASAMCWH